MAVYKICINLVSSVGKLLYKYQQRQKITHQRCVSFSEHLPRRKIHLPNNVPGQFIIKMFGKTRENERLN